MRSHRTVATVFVLFAFPLVMVQSACAQSATTISFADFEVLTLGPQTTIKEVIETQPTLETLEQRFGTDAPTRDCTGAPVSEDCTLIWPGLEIWASHPGDGWEVTLIRVTTSSWAVQHGSTPLQVGSPLTNLASVFPAAYADRGQRCFPDLGCSHGVSVSPSGWDVTIDFLYDPATEVIHEVRVFALN
jgi:hypothetical protein